MYKLTGLLMPIFLLCTCMLEATAPDGADVVLFKNGDTLTGTVLRATSATVTFSNSRVGILTLKWSDIQSLDIKHKIRVISGPSPSTTKDFSSGKIWIVPPTANQLDIGVKQDDQPAVVPVQDVQSLTGIDRCASGIQSACSGWQISKFKINTAWLAATQHQQTYGAELDLLRNWSPQADGWPHERSRILLSPTYDDKRKNNKPGSANVTQDYGGKFQQLFFLTNDNFWGSAIADFYRNNSLGIYFQQSYGAGVGGIMRDIELNADIRFIGEHFYQAPSAALVGSQLSERYSFALDFIKSGATLTETGIFVPVFNAARAWQAQGLIELSIPITAKLGFSTTLSDYYVENTPPAFRKNYRKTTVGLTFTPTKH